MTRAIVLGGSRGIGKAISDSLKSINFDVVATSKKDLDTSNLNSVKKFLEIEKETDILILNTGGPPAKEFLEITEKDWMKYHNQLFLGFCLILKNLSIKKNGYIFLITSGVIKEPNPKLIISSAYRLAFSSVFKIRTPFVHGYDTAVRKNVGMPKLQLERPSRFLNETN